ncbi:MAG: quinoprotein relay system zinc metallohydrolase 1 [Pseudomonadota bacterium]
MPRRLRDQPWLTRRAALAGLGSLAGVPYLAMLDADAAPLAYQLVPRKLADGIWMIAGAQEAINSTNGGAIANIIVLDSSEGAIVVDTGPSRRYGEALASLARELTGKDIARVYITHFHPDHVFGNQAFDAAKIAAPQGVIDGLRKLGDDFATAMYHAVGDWMRGTEPVLPTRVVEGGLEEVGDRRLRLLPLAGHTDSDLAIFDERSGLVVAGDLVFLDRAPTTPHAEIGRWRVALATLGGIPHSLLVPGHGPAEPGGRGIEQTRRWLDAIDELIRDAFDKGLSMNEAAALPLPEWTSSIALARYELERSVAHIFPKLEAKELPRLDGKG